MAIMIFLATLLAIFVSSFAKIAYDTLSFYWLTPRRIRKRMAKQGVYGPDPRPFTGNILDVVELVKESMANDMSSTSHDIVDRLLPYYSAWTKQYGKRFIYWNGMEPRLCLTEMELVKEILGKSSNVCGRSWMQRQGTKHFIGNGLLMANGEAWHHQRHLVSPAFRGERLKSYAGLMVECTNKMIQSLETQLEEGQSVFEIADCMKRLTADIISRTAFDTSSDKGIQIFDMLTQLQHLCAQASRHLCIPGSRFFPSKYNRKIKALKMEVERMLMEIIGSRKEGVEIGRSSGYGSDLLGMLLKEMQRKRDDGFSLDLQLVMDECKTFFFAGHDTTSLLLSWTIMLLATNPSWQHKTRAEVAQVCNGRPPSVEHLPKLTLLNMVINESLRLYPPATVLPRIVFKDIKVGDLEIPKGLSVWIPVLAIHHSEELWGKDANEFNPERFESKAFSGGRFLPFSSGPRTCIGQGFALMEAKIILAMLLSKFSFTISDTYRHAPVVVLTIQPKYGIQVCLTPLPS
ncbi:cytokinin hydroxylase-like [Cucurbita maxima]|uniref:Cytokinin hydroxylase-like n=1 Tax=Cucurbita maxima TaxID=3661 RepID=A0A6J1KAH1_CUCMA|nr:cytokinin hydroxylase-like [Cucurbita maxima]